MNTSNEIDRDGNIREWCQLTQRASVMQPWWKGPF